MADFRESDTLPKEEPAPQDHTEPVKPEIPEKDNAVNRARRIPEAPEDFDIADSKDTMLPVSELRELVESEPARTPKKSEHDRPGKELPSTPPGKERVASPGKSGDKKERGEFKLLGVSRVTLESEIRMVPGDQRMLPLVIYCAEPVYKKLMDHAESGLNAGPENSAVEVKGALIGLALIGQFPIVVICDALRFPISPNDRNDQCSFDAVEDEIIRRYFAAKAEGLSVVGYYHSHPDHPLFFSAFDAQMHNRRCNTSWKIGIVVQPRDRQIGFFIKMPGNNTSLHAFKSGQKPCLIVSLDADQPIAQNDMNQLEHQRYLMEQGSSPDSKSIDSSDKTGSGFSNPASTAPVRSLEREASKSVWKKGMFWFLIVLVSFAAFSLAVWFLRPHPVNRVVIPTEKQLEKPAATATSKSKTFRKEGIGAEEEEQATQHADSVRTPDVEKRTPKKETFDEKSR